MRFIYSVTFLPYMIVYRGLSSEVHFMVRYFPIVLRPEVFLEMGGG
jgi:hypothetical protein